ncbi:response regulator transcription factor [Albimonas pacifica]|uniref:Two component transcriptional regulator, LuxR family n=1 Tax=Albimonas pacifica TaxID=1114924 RepID=A0A1I3GYL5_9RHOB|nr:response regulator [Albimonas pacifica]SFI28456.1 two component transcriptional regulator, LuxR family [Albimonas pacifica]
MDADEEGPAPTVFVVDDDADVREAVDGLLRSLGLRVECFASTEAFVDAGRLEAPGCLVLDIRLRGRSGLSFLAGLRAEGSATPVVVMSAHVDVPMAVQAMKDGALDVLAKPVRPSDLIEAVNRALALDAERRRERRALDALRRAHASLSEREREVMERVTDGASNRETAAALGIAEATVKIHRAAAMRKMGARNLPELVDAARRLRP